MTSTAQEPTSPDNTPAQKTVAEILRAIENLRYGSIEITVHEGRITQIERREKVRLNQT